MMWENTPCNRLLGHSLGEQGMLCYDRRKVMYVAIQHHKVM